MFFNEYHFEIVDSWNNISSSSNCSDLLSKKEYCSNQILVEQTFSMNNNCVMTNDSNGSNQKSTAYYAQLNQLGSNLSSECKG